MGDFNREEFLKAKTASTNIEPIPEFQAGLASTDIPGGKFNPDKNEKGLSPGNMDRINSLRATNQSGWDQAGNAIIGGVASGGLTAVETLGWMADAVGNPTKHAIKSAINDVTETEKYTRNAVQQWAVDSKDYIAENMPIYQQPGDWNWDDPGFYWSATKGIIDSAVGFAIPGGIASKAVGYGLRAARVGSLLGRAAVAAGEAAGVESALAKSLTWAASKPGQQVVHNLAAGYLSNYGESKIMAVETFEQSMEYMKPLIEAGKMTEKEARTIAGNQASNFELMNKIFMFTDAYSYGKIFGGEGVTRGAIKESAKQVALASLKDAPVEYFEEVSQNVMQSESLYQAKLQADVASKTNRLDRNKEGYTLGERVWNYTSSAQAQLEGLMGLVSGPMQSFGMDRISTVISSGAAKKQKELQDADIEFAKKETSNLISNYDNISKEKDKAMQEGRFEDAQIADDAMWATVKYKAFRSGTADVLEEHIKAMTDSEKKAEMLADLKTSERNWVRLSGSDVQFELFTATENKRSLEKAAEGYQKEMLRKKAAAVAGMEAKQIVISSRDGKDTANGKKSNGGNVVKTPITFTPESLPEAPIISEIPAVQARFQEKYTKAFNEYMANPLLVQAEQAKNVHREILRNIAAVNDNISYLNTSKGVSETLKAREEYQKQLEERNKAALKAIEEAGILENANKVKEEAAKKAAEAKGTTPEQQAKDIVDNAIAGSTVVKEAVKAEENTNPTNTGKPVVTKPSVIDETKPTILEIEGHSMQYDPATDQVVYQGPIDPMNFIKGTPEEIAAERKRLSGIVRETVNKQKAGEDPYGSTEEDLVKPAEPTPEEVVPTTDTEEGKPAPVMEESAADIKESLDRIVQHLLDKQPVDELSIEDQAMFAQHKADIQRMLTEAIVSKTTLTPGEEAANIEVEAAGDTVNQGSYDAKANSTMANSIESKMEAEPYEDPDDAKQYWQGLGYNSIDSFFRPKGIWGFADTYNLAERMKAFMSDDRILDPNYLPVGSEVKMSVDTNYKGPITLYRSDITGDTFGSEKLPPYTGKTVTKKTKFDGGDDYYLTEWEDYINWLDAVLGKDEDGKSNYLKSRAYLGRVPVKIEFQGKTIGYLRVTSRVKSDANNLYTKRPHSKGETDAGNYKENLFRIRNHIVEKGIVSTKITRRTPGIVLATDSENKSKNVGSDVFDKNVKFLSVQNGRMRSSKYNDFTDPYEVTHSNVFVNGTHAVIPNGKGTNNIIAVQHSLLDAPVVDSLMNAFEIYINNKNLTDAQRSIAQEISSMYAINILEPKGIRDYFAMFTHVIKLNDQSTLSDSASRPDGVLLGFKGNELRIKSGLAKELFVNPYSKPSELSYLLPSLRTQLTNTYFNVNMDKLGTTGAIPLIAKSETGEYKTNEYTDYHAVINKHIRTYASSVVLSNGTRIYTVQSNINLDLNSLLGDARVLEKPAQSSATTTVVKETATEAAVNSSVNAGRGFMMQTKPIQSGVVNTAQGKMVVDSHGLVNVNQAYALMQKTTISAKIAELTFDQEAGRTYLDKASNTYVVNGKAGFTRTSNLLKPDNKVPNTPDIIASQDAGTAVDVVVRDFFSPEGVKAFENYEGTMTLNGYNTLVTSLAESMDALKKKYRILSNNVIVHDINSNVAGELDLLVELDGDFYIIDTKSSRSFANYGTVKDKFNKYQSHAEQLNAYRIMLWNTHGIVIKGLFVLPITISRPDADPVVTSAKVGDLIQLPIGKLEQLPTLGHPLAGVFPDKAFLSSNSKVYFATITPKIEESTAPTHKVGDSTIQLNMDEDEDNTTDYLPGPLDEEAINNVISEMMHHLVIKGLPLSAQHDLISQLSYDINNSLKTAAKVNNKSISRSAKEVLDKYKAIIEKDLAARRATNKSITKAQVRFETILTNWDQVEKMVINNLKTISGVKVQKVKVDDSSEDMSSDGNSENVRSSYNEDWVFSIDEKRNMSGKVRRFLSFIPSYKRRGDSWVKEKNSLFGYEKVQEDGEVVVYNPKLKDFDVVFNTLQASISNAKVGPYYDKMMDHLREEARNMPWFNDVVKQLDSAPQDVKNQFVTTMYRHDNNMVYVNWSFINGQFIASVAKSNANALQSAIRAQWDQNLLLSDIVTKDPKSGELTVDPESEKVKELISTYEKWTADYVKGQYPSADEFMEFMAKLGITLSPQTVNDIVSYGIPRRGGRTTYYSSLFQPFSARSKNSSDQLLHDLVNELRGLRLDADGELKPTKISLDNLSMFSSVKALLDLARVEARFNEKVWASSFRISGKSINAYMADQFSFARANELKDEDKLDELLKLPYLKQSKLLQDLKNNKEFREVFDIFTMSLDPLIKKAARRLNNTKLSKHGKINHEIIKLTMFADSQTITGDRIVKMFFPTQSDKERMIAFNFSAMDVRLDTQGKLAIPTLDKIVNYLVLPEVLRMYNNSEVDLEGYNEGKQLFYTIPELNGIQELWNSDGTLKPGILSDESTIGDNYRKLVRDAVEKHIDSLAENKLKEWSKMGISDSMRSYIPASYYGKRADYKEGDSSTVITDTRVLAYDFEVNSLLGNLSMQQAFQGDIAEYYKSSSKAMRSAQEQRLSLFKKINEISDDIRSTPEKYEAEVNRLLKMSSLYKSIKDTATNLGKRTAADIAPGLVPAIDPNNRYYQQAFLADPKVTSKANEYIISLTGNKAFSKMDGADAQELTTFKEHMDVMRLFGRVTDEEYNYLIAAEKKEALTKTDINKILSLDNNINAMKPVYVGNHIEHETGIDRRVYVKSSSYPLVRQLTRTFEIDKLREAMETQGIARAAFSSAVKAGNFTAPDDIWVKNGDITDGTIKDNLVLKSIMTMDRANFRLQQDVPSDLTHNEINRTTQGAKNLFTNLIHNPELKGVMLDYKGEQISIESLLDKYNENYENLFRIEREKIEKELFSKGTLNTVKLSKLLLKEAEERNYPLNAKLGLEVNSNGNFKLPLWASPSSKQYEGIMNSIVKNRVLRATLPGYSYVLASEVGYKVKPEFLEGEAGMKKLTELSGVVFTKHFDPKVGLHPGGLIDGVARPAQVFVPNKFIGADGSVLDLAKLVGPDGLLDTTKVPEELLEQLGFRIPNQLHNSSSWIQIAGFLPPHAGDIIIAPADFTKQMGSDFDIDKLYSYARKYIIDQEGSLKVWNYEDAYINYLLEAADNKDNIDAAIAAGLFENDSQGVDINDVIRFLNEEGKIMSQEEFEFKHRDIKHRMDVIEAHLAIYKSNNEFIQSQIKEELGYGPFEKMADEYTEKFSAEEDFISPYSSSYQRDKYVNATAGKDGVGVFSLDAVFNSLLQQSKTGIEFPPISEDTPFMFSLVGNYSYNQGKGHSLSDKFVMDPTGEAKKVAKSLQIAWFQSVSVDNEKLQILGALNINSQTFEVIKALNQMGFPADVIVAFINQDSIKDYVELVKNYSGITAEYSSKSPEERAFDEVTERYKRMNAADFDMKDHGKYLYEIPGAEDAKGKTGLKSMIGNKSVPNYAYKQLALLTRFRQAQKHGEVLRKVQTALNVDSGGLGNNFFESTSRQEQLSEILDNEYLIGLKDIIGDYIPVGESRGMDYRKLGYYKFGSYNIKPKGIVGSAIVHGLGFNNSLWDSVLPYRASEVLSTFESLKSVIRPSLINNEIASTRIKETAWSHMKSFMFADQSLGFTSESIQLERKRLLTDSDTNMSLASIIRTMKKLEYPIIMNNPFINNLLLDTPDYRKPSVVRFNSASAEGFDESKYYAAFLDLLSNDAPLGTYNGITYTSRLLAQDLILAAYASGGLQEAVQYTKFIPNAYFDLLPLGNYLRNITFKNSSSSMFGPRFIKQFIQHNPDFAHRVRVSDHLLIKESEVRALDIVDENGLPIYTASENDITENSINPIVGLKLNDDQLVDAEYIYDEESKMLFVKEGTGFYLRIPLLGTTFVREYQPAAQVAGSFIGKNNIGIALDNTARYALKTGPNYEELRAGGSMASSYMEEKYGLDSSALGIGLNDVDPMYDAFNRIADEGRSIGAQVNKGQHFGLGLLAQMYANVPKEVFGDLKIAFRNNSWSSYDYQTRLMVLNPTGKNGLEFKKMLLHEATHAAMTSWGVREYEAFKNGKAHKLNERQLELYQSLDRMHSRLLDEINNNPSWKEEFQYFKNEMDKKRASELYTKSFSAEDLSRNYGAYSLAEFISMAMTDRNFQEILNTIPYTEDKSFWERFKDWVSDFLTVLGFKTEGTLLASTVGAVTELVNTEGSYSSLRIISPIKTIRSLIDIAGPYEAIGSNVTVSSNDDIDALLRKYISSAIDTPQEEEPQELKDLHRSLNVSSEYTNPVIFRKEVRLEGRQVKPALNVMFVPGFIQNDPSKMIAKDGNIYPSVSHFLAATLAKEFDASADLDRFTFMPSNNKPLNDYELSILYRDMLTSRDLPTNWIKKETNYLIEGYNLLLNKNIEFASQLKLTGYTDLVFTEESIKTGFKNTVNGATSLLSNEFLAGKNKYGKILMYVRDNMTSVNTSKESRDAEPLGYSPEAKMKQLEEQIIQLTNQLTEATNNQLNVADTLEFKVASYLSKVSKESLEAETGGKTGKDFPASMVTKDGPSVEAEAEAILSDLRDANQVMDNVEPQDIRNMIIEIATAGGVRKYKASLNVSTERVRAELNLELSKLMEELQKLEATQEVASQTPINEPEQVYSLLGNKTESSKVIIKSLYQKEGVDFAKKHNAVFSLRVNGTDKHFGNPFSPDSKLVKEGNLIKVKTTKEAVIKYIDWVLNSTEPRAQWIRDVLKSGELKGKQIIYYKELGEPSHATAIDYLINKYDWSSNSTDFLPSAKPVTFEQIDELLKRCK